MSKEDEEGLPGPAAFLQGPSAPAEPAEPAAPSVQKYTFFVGPGNNSELVRSTFQRRPWWELGKEDDPELNLKWLQVRSRPVAEAVRKAGSKQFLNHLDGLQCIGRKNELYFNLKAYCEREKIDVHQMAPPTFIVAAGEACPEYQEFARVCKAMENKNRVGNAALARKATEAKGPASPAKGAGGGALGDDAASAAATDEHMSSASSQASAATIKSPSKAGGKNDGNKSPRKSKAGASRGDAIGSINTAGTANIWIVKPTNNNRGNGIKVFNSFAAIEEHLRKKSLGGFALRAATMSTPCAAEICSGVHYRLSPVLTRAKLMQEHKLSCRSISSGRCCTRAASLTFGSWSWSTTR